MKNSAFSDRLGCKHGHTCRWLLRPAIVLAVAVAWSTARAWAEDVTLGVGPGHAFQSIKDAVEYADDNYGYFDTVTIRVWWKANPYEEEGGILIHRAVPPRTKSPLLVQAPPPVLDDVPLLILEGAAQSSESQRPVVTGTAGEGGATIRMQGGVVRGLVVRRYEDPPDSGIYRHGIAVYSGVALVESCRVEGFDRVNQYGHPEKGILVFCATDHGQMNPSTVWDCDIVDNGCGIEFGETLGICAWNRICDNWSVGVCSGFGGVSQIFSNLIEGNGGSGVELHDAGLEYMWTNYSEVCSNTICNNGSNGIEVEQLSPDSMPVSAVVRDNDIGGNGGYGVYCHTSNGCWPHLRNNNVWDNALGSYNEYCPAAISSISADPGYDDNWYLPPGSPNMDRGSMLLEAGATLRRLGGALVPDTGVLDLGYHHPVDWEEEGDSEGIQADDVCLVCQWPDMDPACDYYSIQDAIDNHSKPKPGTVEIIKVRSYPARAYEEHIVVPQSAGGLIIESEYPGAESRPVINARGKRGVELAFGGTFRNFCITGTHMTVGKTGVSVEGPCRVESCAVLSQGIGISVTGDAGAPLIAYNIVSGNRTCGIELAGGSCAQVFSNWVEYNRVCGMVLHSSAVRPGFAEISNNTVYRNGQPNGGGDGIAMDYVPGDQPLCPYMRDNVVFENYGYGISCSRPYGPFGGSDDGGCYPNMRYNNVWFNQYITGGVPPGYGTDPDHNYLNCPTCLGGGGFGCHGRIMMPMSVDPRYQGKFLSYVSECIDAGSTTLEPGANHWQGSLLWPDTGRLDIGYHHPPSSCPWLDD